MDYHYQQTQLEGWKAKLFYMYLIFFQQHFEPFCFLSSIAAAPLTHVNKKIN